MGQQLGMSVLAAARLEQKRECPQVTRAIYTPEPGAMMQTLHTYITLWSSCCSSCGDAGICWRRRVDVIIVVVVAVIQGRWFLCHL